MSETPLTGLFSSRTLVRALSVLLLNADRAYYQQELVRIVGGPLRPTQLALERLVRADLVTKRREGKQVYYQAQVAHPAFPDLRSFFLKTFALADVLSAALEPVSEGIAVAFVFGSVADSANRARSDVDLFVVGNVGRRDLSGALSAAEAVLGREVNANVFDRDRLRAAIERRDPFVRDVLAGPKIWVVGDADALERVAG